MTKQSKSDRIRKILHLPNAVIAERIGCRKDYVRAVRQRTSLFGNPITDAANRNWQAENKERINARIRKRYRFDPEFRQRRQAIQVKSRKRRAEAPAS